MRTNTIAVERARFIGSQLCTETSVANWREKLVLSRTTRHLYSDVVEKLTRIEPWRGALSANCSDKLWLASLKPSDPTPILILP
jgi:hypothetical protein